jgi:polyisoprenoid-binding protein YceI
MMRRMICVCLIAAALAGLCVGMARAQATHPWTVDYAHSHLGFTGTQGTDLFEGSFKKFKADIDLDPDHPETGKITVTVDTRTVTTGDSQRDQMLPHADWFYVGEFPQAQFVSTQIHKTGDNGYETQGTLTLKGLSHVITLPFTLTPEGDHWRAQGKVTLVRSDFHIGEGDWADEKIVKLNVDVFFDLVARPQ